MYTISRFAEMFGLSRSTLLYYEKIKLMNPPQRNASGYRLYSEEDKTRLERINVFRNIGVPLEKIRTYLNASADGVLPILINRLICVNDELTLLKNQQEIILGMIEAEGSLKGKKQFFAQMVEFGKKVGITETNYERIHRVFEKTAPRAHRRLLDYLGFSESDTELFLKKLKEKN